MSLPDLAPDDDDEYKIFQLVLFFKPLNCVIVVFTNVCYSIEWVFPADRLAMPYFEG